MSGSTMGTMHFDAAVEVARHPVGARNEHFVLSAVLEVGDAGVLEEAIDERAHLDAFADAGDLGAQAADAAHEKRDGDAGLRRVIERVDDVGVDERVHLGDDPRGPPGARVLRFARDEPQHGLVQAERSDDEQVPLGRRAVTGEQVEERRRVFADLLARREERKVGVEARRRGVVVARRQVDVAAELVLFAPHDERGFGVRLQAEKAVDDVNAGLLERARPLDVALLVEARLELDDGRHLLAVLGRARRAP